ncbi:3-hydroxybutyrate dehydrogenase [Stackebrandtia nassauensis]|uniref:3-hydroxybutyrate dehydrogenase n=1 Tax=Stackebrandtia nassauensis (strain DSM 44728 / CIP 108903 / NRRL B-16338 / NBRC 102104 / LLR-40K-21) TaxID=446470 RepID=D3PUU1_STANL|nr:3-hydroxybutyrate dehydrogenase [Stackebrandtia nassauensis]ADD44965.1 3-hydroxybutyrate dehydrogenase [Stackebrandtia nassauensis DSM 44728]
MTSLPFDEGLSGRTVVITGGASGIGLACVHRFAAAGAKVVVADVSQAAEQVAAEVGGTAWIADLSNPDSVDECPVSLRDTDILVNNAGAQHVAPLHEFPSEVFARLQRLMVETPFRLIRAVLPGMYERDWGRIVNISSVHGVRASPFKAAYVAAKHALEGLSKVVALEAAEHGVTSNCVRAAYVRTPLVERQIAEQARLHGLSKAEVVERIMLRPTAIKRLVEPEEVADSALYLCSGAAAFVTGSAITLDGGWTSH